MVTPVQKWLVAGIAAAGCMLVANKPSFAQNAPGEDPVRLDKKVFIQMLPYGSAPRSGNISPTTEMPAWQKARIARYEAKAASGNTGDILTGKDVVTSSTNDGFKTTCTQSVGSSTGATTAAGFPKEQIVVLRGDLVNICN